MQVVMPYRCDDLDCQHLRLMGDLGQACLWPYSHESNMAHAVQGMYESCVTASLAMHACVKTRRGAPPRATCLYDKCHVRVCLRPSKAVIEALQPQTVSAPTHPQPWAQRVRRWWR